MRREREAIRLLVDIFRVYVVENSCVCRKSVFNDRKNVLRDKQSFGIVQAVGQQLDYVTQI